MGEDRDTAQDRVTIQEAARRLGVKEDAIRKRIQRDTLRHEKTPEGRVFVWVDATQDTAQDTTQDATQDTYRDALVDELRSRVTFLEGELQRKDAILLNMTETMKAIAPPAQEVPPLGPPPVPPGRVEPQDSLLATLLPSTREKTAEEKSTRATGWWLNWPLARYVSYAIGIVLTAMFAIFDFFYSPGGVDLGMRLLFAAAFGIYVGIKDGTGRPVGRFNIIGAVAGLLTWVVALYLSEVSLVAAYVTGDLSPVVSLVLTHFIGTWWMFIFGLLIGTALQIKAEEMRGRPQDRSLSSSEHGAVVRDARSAATVGVVGVIVAALLQTIGQIGSALVGNSGP